MRPVVRLHFQNLALALALAAGRPAAERSAAAVTHGCGRRHRAGAGHRHRRRDRHGRRRIAGAGQTGGSIGTGAGGDGALASCPTTAITPTPLRRLTKFEYANSVRNLLGVDTTPANDLPADEVTEGFNNNAGVLTVSSLHAEKYVLVSEALAK